MIDRKEIELLIRAQLKGGRDLASITKSIEDLQRAIEQQSEAAKRGEKVFDQLKASQEALKVVQEELASRGSLLRSLGRDTAALDKQRAAVEKNAQALDAYIKKVGDKRTEKQQAEVQRLTRRYDESKSRLDALTKSVDIATAALRETGIEASNVAAAQKQISDAVARTAETQARANTEILQYNQNLEAGRKAAQALADQQDKLSRLQRGNEDDARLGRQQQQALLSRLQSGNEADELLAREQAAQRLADQQAKLARLEKGNADDARLIAQQRADAARQQAAEEQRLFDDAARRADAQRAARERDAADVERIQRNRRAQSAAEGRLFEEEAARQKRATELAELRADIERRSAQSVATTQRDTALRKTADDAEQAARGYTSLARASTDLTPRVVSLRDAIEQIKNPATAALKTIDGLESQITATAKTITASNGAVKDYADEFKNLQAAQKAIGTQAGLIDGFKNQLATLKQSRAEFVAARAQVQQYAAAVRQGGEAGEQFARPLAEAQIRLRQATTAMREQIIATRQSREGLRQAGISTADLAGAQQRLVEATRVSTNAMRQLGSSAEQNAQAVSKSSSGFKLFRDEGRTTLSFVQRLRGEILALTTAYFGVQGAIGLAADSLKKFSEAQGLRSTLAFALGGDPRAVGDEVKYIATQADRLGISFEEASKGYAKFAASAVKSGAPIQEARFIFESFTEVGRVLNLSPDQLNGLFNAIGQSFSKGKIQAEELRSQIGERLPAAFAFAQDALKGFFPDLDKALVEGKVGVENFVLIAESVRRAAADQLPAAIKNLDAEQQRFNNSVLFFKQQIASAGFADAYVALLKQLTEFFKSNEGQEFATSLGKIAGALVNGLGALVSWRDELTLIAGVLGALLAGSLLAKFGTGIAAIGTAASAATLSLGLFSKVALTLSLGLGALATTLLKLAGVITAVGIAAFSFGNYLYEQFPVVRSFGVFLVTEFAKIWSRVKFGAMEVWEDLPRLAENGLKALINQTTFLFRQFLNIFRVGANALGLTGLGDNIAKAIDALTLRYNTQISSRVKQIRSEGEADLKRIEGIAKEMYVDALRLDKVQLSNRQDTTKAPPKRNSAIKADDTEAKKRQKEIESIDDALDALAAKTLKKQGETLESLLGAVDLQYKDLGDRIAKIGGPVGQEFAKRFREGIAALKLEITKDFNDKILAEQEALQSKLEQLDAAAGRKDKQNLQARLDAVRESQGQLYRDIEDFRGRLVSAGRDPGFADQAKRRADAAVLELQNLERIKYLKEQLEAKEASINDLLKARELAIKRIEEQVIAGDLTRSQADTQIRTLIAQLQPQIDAAAQSAAEFAVANEGAFDPARLQEFLLKLQQATNSGKALNAEFDRTGQIINNGIGQGLDGVFDSLYESLVQLGQGTKDLGDVFEDAGRVMLQVIAQTLRELAVLYLKEQALIAIQAIRIAMGGGNGIGYGSGGVGVQHGGGMAGRSNRTRSVNPAWFSNAPRYHSGGIVGLAPDEYPAILQRNEEVLSASDPRNVMNGGGAQGKSSAPQMTRFVLVDERSRVPEAMAGPEGEQVIVQHIKRNLPTIRQLLK